METLAEKAESLRKTVDINIFKGYDIRGDAQVTAKSPKINLREEDAFLIGQALASSYTSKQQTPRFLITSDHRPTSETLRLALAHGAKDAGAKVDINGDPVPTGATSWTILQRKDLYDIAIQITGSHNPYYNNGFKITSKQDDEGNPDVNGFPQALYGENLKKIHRNIVEDQVEKNCEGGEVNEINYVNEEYQKAMIDYFAPILPNDQKFTTPFRVVLDAGNGLGCKAVEILRALGVEVYEMFTDLHGEFPNHPADPSKQDGIKMAQDKVREFNSSLEPGEQPWIAAVFDGDGDRSGVIAEDGNVIYPERILAIFYIRFLLENKLGLQNLHAQNEHVGLALDVRGTAVVGELISEYHQQKKYGIVSEFIPCGYPNHRSYVRRQIEKLTRLQDDCDVETRQQLENIKKTYTSAEASGHFFYATCKNVPQAMVDDGIFSAIKLLQIVDTIRDYEAKENFIAEQESYKIVDLFNAISWRPVSNEVRGASPYEDQAKEDIICDIKKVIAQQKENPTQFSQKITELIDVDGIRVVFDDNSFLLVRASQTSPKFTYKFEAQTKERLVEVISETIEFLKSYTDQGVSLVELQEELSLQKSSL
ncbi:hypothetical protein [Candidatus Uabimicrobium amorphum]|uniref:Phosphomannomutase/phosphoglucomutase n=1 Tax=Uabimicrobium amorphum TaxID=2596890 RepID=A0A5S9IIM6_UABAM|nr:hypothetical protein [Candidatus Uabimicrobium amorphum]BBM82493.1 phosphomannomutase/phosphoglucomutase [Candidatus Uabimicrobium amorphum]